MPDQINIIGRPRKPRFLLYLFCFIVLLYVLFFLPTPYVIFEPGSAEKLKPMVTVKNGYPEEKGSFMLTTVRLLYANPALYLYALTNPNMELYNKRDLLQNGESQNEFNHRQEFIMEESQSNAIQAAYHKAGVAYHIETRGVMILQTVAGMPAARTLQSGDFIIKLNDILIKTREDMLRFMAGQKKGAIIAVTYKRGEAEHQVSLELGVLPKEPGDVSAQERIGLGVVPVDLQFIKADQEDKQVEVDAGNIGGPSAGFMFSLEIYNRLVPEDITKGYRIAGTGTIESTGEIGPIGGIKHKVVAADREGADIFFAPVKNADEALQSAKRIHSKMKIVIVKKMEDGLQYLEGLPSKP